MVQVSATTYRIVETSQFYQVVRLSDDRAVGAFRYDAGLELTHVGIPEAKEASIAGTEKHLALRKKRSRPLVGRSNYLFVGNEAAGHNLAGLYTLVASCGKNGVNAIAYLTDVLARVQKHPASRIEELLPHRWKPPGPPPTAALPAPG